METPIKNNKERNRRLWQSYIVIVLVSLAYYTDRFGPGTYTGDWKVYAVIVAAVFAVGAGYITVTDIIERKLWGGKK